MRDKSPEGLAGFMSVGAHCSLVEGWLIRGGDVDDSWQKMESEYFLMDK